MFTTIIIISSLYVIPANIRDSVAALILIGVLLFASLELGLLIAFPITMFSIYGIILASIVIYSTMDIIKNGFRK